MKRVKPNSGERERLTLDESNRQAFGLRLRSVLPAGMSQADVAGKIGVAPTTLKNWLSGASEPVLSNLVALSDVVGHPLEWLATGKAPAEPPPPIIEKVTQPLDGELLVQIVVMLEAWLRRHGRDMAPEAKGRFVAQAYALCLEDAQEAGVTPTAIVEKSMPRYLRLVS